MEFVREDMSAFEGARLKIDRAYDQAVELNDEMAAIFGPGNNRDAYEVVCERQSDPRQWRAVFRLLKRPSDTWAVRIGEIVHNLRSALDHLVYEASAKRRDGHPLPRTEFPIFIDRDRFFSSKRGGGLDKIRGLNKETQAFVEQAQPFNSDNPLRHSLWLLQELSNADKHRLLNMVGMVWISKGLLKIKYGLPEGGVRISEDEHIFRQVIEVSEGPLGDAGGEFIRFETPSIFPPETQMNVDMDINVGMVFGDAGTTAAGLAINPAINEIGKSVGIIRQEFVRLNASPT